MMMSFYATLNFWAPDDSHVSGARGWWDWAAAASLDTQQHWGLPLWQVLLVRALTVKAGREGVSQLLVRISPGKRELADPKHFI